MTRFVLVHGAWSDGAAWEAVVARRLATSHMAMLSDPDGLAAALPGLTT